MDTKDLEIFREVHIVKRIMDSFLALAGESTPPFHVTATKRSAKHGSSVTSPSLHFPQIAANTSADNFTRLCFMDISLSDGLPVGGLAMIVA